MNNKSLSTLEYNKIISRLVSFACSDGAKQILHKLEPMTDIDKRYKTRYYFIIFKC